MRNLISCTIFFHRPLSFPYLAARATNVLPPCSDTLSCLKIRTGHYAEMSATSFQSIDPVLFWSENINDAPLQLFKGWSSLPTEIKLEILRHILVFRRPIKVAYHWALPKYYLAPLILAGDRQLAQLARDIYYKENEFVLFRCSVKDPGHIWRSPQPAVAALIQRLAIRITIHSHQSHSEYWPNIGEWRYLLAPRPNAQHFGNPLFGSNTARWQQSFRRLKRLTVSLVVGASVLNLDRCLKDICRTKSLNKLTAYATIYLCAEQVDVRVKGVPEVCSHWPCSDSQVRTCQEASQERLAGTIRELVMENEEGQE